jgi:heme oxygenase
MAPTDAMSPVVLHTGALEGSSCPFRTAVAVLRKPSLQFILAASVALAAGLLAWYYM